MSSAPHRRTVARRGRAEAPGRFDVDAHREPLLAILCALDAEPGRPLDPLLRAHPRGGVGFFSRAELLAGARALAEPAGLCADPSEWARRLRLRPVRTHSGVTPVTVLTKPFPCPGRCVFCPNDVRMPKSYLSDEPGAQRAAANRFDPYAQVWSRLAAYHAIGHPTEKVELIVLGGTWSHYPGAYQRWFAGRCLQAMSDFEGGGEASPVPQSGPEFGGLEDGDGSYNAQVARHLRAGLSGALVSPEEAWSWEALESQQRRNEEASSRCVGLSLETRPDEVTPDEVRRLRRLGATKIQIGVQYTDDAVLARNARGHDLAATRRALALLRAAGFKLQAHWMANLLGATPEGDRQDYERLFEDPALRPDELKLYPCSLVESAELMEHYESGAWAPYDHASLLRVVRHGLAVTPRWCRLSRVIRDISSDDIVAGNKLTNFREIAERELLASGGRAGDIRAREIRGEAFDEDALVLEETRYATAVGEECFLEWTTPEDRIVGFLRLALPDGRAPCPVPELAGSALIREVHVYGASLPLAARGGADAQHRGLGGRLVERAVELAEAAGFRRLSVISAVGTRPWYRRLGFADGALYQHRQLAPGR